VTLREFADSAGRLFESVRGSPFGWAIDLADILILAYLIYQLALLIRGTRAVQMMTGILFIIAAYFATGILQLSTVQRFLGYLLYWIPFAVIVIFQNTIRRALSRFGRNPFFRKGSLAQGEAMINELVMAATSLASRRIGGLILIEREQGLRNYLETGIPVDALLSYDLILSLSMTVPSSFRKGGFARPPASSRSRRTRRSPRSSARATAPPSASRRRLTPWPSWSRRSGALCRSRSRDGSSRM